MRVCSFDVFDTVVTRLFATPKDLFLQLGAEARRATLVDVPPERFAQLRVELERKARLLRPHHEVSLDEIYLQLGSYFEWPADVRERIKQMELALEELSIRAVPCMAKTVREARAEFDRVIFISDMYLPAGFLKSVLRKQGILLEGDDLFLSHERCCSKGNSQLFAEVRRTFPAIQHWLHVGDHPHADVQVPSALGIATRHFTGAQLTRYERLARGSETPKPIWRSQLAAAMRLARLANPGLNPSQTVIWNTGCNVVGPLLVGFVHWCLEEASARGIKTLHFVSRDGQILHRIAQILAPAWKYEVECRYLYGSRQAWHQAAIGQLDAAHFDWIFHPRDSSSVRQVFSRLGLIPDSYKEELQRAGFAAKSWDDALPPEAQQNLQRLLVSMREVIESASRAKRQTIVSYLRQEGFLNHPCAAMVDIGWHGNLQNSLSRILALSHQHPAELMGFYFGLVSGKCFSSQNKLKAYWNEFAGPEKVLQRENLALFEIFTAATHGSVVGYQPAGEVIEPVFNKATNAEAMAWGLPVLQEAIATFAITLTETLGRNSFSSRDYFEITSELHRLFYQKPSREEAQVWGSFRFSDDQLESTFQQLVPAWTNGQILSALLGRNKRRGYWWHQGSLALRTCLPLSLYLRLRALKQRLMS